MRIHGTWIKSYQSVIIPTPPPPPIHPTTHPNPTPTPPLHPTPTHPPNGVHVWPVNDPRILLSQKSTRIPYCVGRGIVLDIHKVSSKNARRPRKYTVRTQDSGRDYSTQNYTWKYYIRSTLQNSTSILNKYGPDIIKHAKMHVKRPLLRS